MDRLPLTVFAPIDRSLGDLLTKAKSRPINLIELAKHHIGKCVPPRPKSYQPTGGENVRRQVS